jgi:heat-inducible transcriptional repressor
MTQRNESNLPLNQRTELILFATIAEYVKVGQPVSSSTLAKKRQLAMSPATIRRAFLKLTKHGYLIQPHTSAGRIPTDSAFRLFANTLKERTGQLTSEKKLKLENQFRSLPIDRHESLQDVVRLLSALADQAALIITPSFSEAILRQLRFIPCGPGSLLAVVVTRDGLVHNSFLNSPEPLSDADLERIHNYLGQLIEGRTLNEIRRLLEAELDDARASCDTLRERATMLGSQAIKSSTESTSDLVVEGRSRLLAQPELSDRLEELLQVLEEKKRILKLLDMAAARDHQPFVIIGRDGGKGFDGCAMISAPFGSQGQIGIIGSSRMNYSSVIPLVDLAAQFLSNRFPSED